MSIQSDRVTLLEITDQDHIFMRELVNSKGWIRFIGDRNILSEQDARAYVSKIRSAENLTYWVIRLKESGIPIGIISFLKRDYLEHFDIGFAMLDAYQGKGYAFEAASVVIRFVKENPLHKVVYATTIAENVNSIKLLRKLGLQFLKTISIEGQALSVYSDDVKK